MACAQAIPTVDEGLDDADGVDTCGTIGGTATTVEGANVRIEAETGAVTVYCTETSTTNTDDEDPLGGNFVVPEAPVSSRVYWAQLATGVVTVLHGHGRPRPGLCTPPSTFAVPPTIVTGADEDSSPMAIRARTKRAIRVHGRPLGGICSSPLGGEIAKPALHVPALQAPTTVMAKIMATPVLQLKPTPSLQARLAL